MTGIYDGTAWLVVGFVFQLDRTLTRLSKWTGRTPMVATPGPNPLASGFFCPTCGNRLEKEDGRCGWGPHDEVPA